MQKLILAIKKIVPKKLRSYNLQAAFTLLEFLIAIAVVLMLAAGGAMIYGQFYTSSQLNETTTQMIQTVRVARERAVARVNDAAHGVYFDTVAKKYTLYQGSSWGDAGKVIIRETTLDSVLSLSTTLAGNDVNFSKGLGLPNTGNITLTHSVSGTRTVSINSFGKIEQ